jgi:hypothetical protein
LFGEFGLKLSTLRTGAFLDLVRWPGEGSYTCLIKNV